MSKTAHEDTEVVIVKTDGVLSGKPRLKGHRISVLDVTELLEIGYSISETADQLGISTEEVRAATRYYRRHRDEMAEIERRRREKRGTPTNAKAGNGVINADSLRTAHPTQIRYCS